MKKIRFFGLLFVLAMACVFLLASCAGMTAAKAADKAPVAEHALDELDDEDHDDHDDQPDYGRLLVHSLDGSLIMLDAYDGDILFTEQQALPAGSAVLYAGKTGEVGYAFGQDHRRAAIVDSGYILMLHGGHHDLVTNRASLVGTFEAELVPDNFYSDGRFAYAADRDEGRVLRLNEVSVRSFTQVPSIDTLEYDRTVAASPAIDAAA
ncbi:MAG: hypothetical protein KKC64_08385, partial [Spirochaetes bacterium]|nr:hypothetical protein [Spirochaetota bacterium]